MSLYDFLQYLHVVLAIVAVGFNASYGIWTARAAKEPEHELHILKGIRTLDDRFANPAYVLLLVTGVSMVLVGDLGFDTLWISAALGLYVVMALVAILLFTPALRKQIALVEAGDQRSEAHAALAKRSGMVGGVLAILVLAIVFLMVTKPV
ncbi:MAG: DUF2269 domain-containing protein [Actinomycetota bacterium]|nr:DUF2269 domain-containing protein [Actinomycetota bacterium]